jgi:hydrogenase-4 component B
MEMNYFMFSGLSNYITRDFLSTFFTVLIVLISIPVLIYSLGYLKEYKEKYSFKYFWMVFSIFILSMIGVVISENSVAFMVFWEIMSISSFFLVIYEHKNKEALKSGINYFIMTHISGVSLMLMFGFIYKFTGSMDFREIVRVQSLIPNKGLIFTFALIGFGAKAGLIPLHAWLPKAHPSAPSNVSALMSGVMLKVAVYGFIRVVFILLGGVSYKYGFVVLLLGTITAIYTIINSLLQSDNKKLLAYSSSENIGIIFAAIGLALILNNLKLYEMSILALTAGLFHALNHGVFKSLLFTGAGSSLYATGTKNMNELGGLYKKMKFTTVCVFIGTAAISSVPPLNGFASESLILLSFIKSAYLLNSKKLLLAIILCGIILALVAGGAIFSAVKAFGITYLGEPRSEKAVHIHQIPLSMKIGMGILAVYSIIFGVFSPFIIGRISRGLSNLLFKKQYITIGAFGYEVTIIAFLFALIILLILLISKLLDKGKNIEVNGTWSCGFNTFKGNMQYSGDGYSQPAARYFGIFAGYKKEANIKASILLKQKTQDVIERLLYRPVINFINLFSNKVVKIHYGKIQLYITYILIALLVSLTLVIKFA